MAISALTCVMGSKGRLLKVRLRASRKSRDRVRCMEVVGHVYSIDQLRKQLAIGPKLECAG